MDGNLHWCPAADAQPPDGYLEKVRAAQGSILNQSKHPGGWEANSQVADPRFILFDLTISAKNNYRLQQDSPAIGKGIVLPAELFDPLRPPSEARPDIGAFPHVAEAPLFGRHARGKLPISKL